MLVHSNQVDRIHSYTQRSFHYIGMFGWRIEEAIARGHLGHHACTVAHGVAYPLSLVHTAPSQKMIHNGLNQEPPLKINQDSIHLFLVCWLWYIAGGIAH